MNTRRRCLPCFLSLSLSLPVAVFCCWHAFTCCFYFLNTFLNAAKSVARAVVVVVVVVVVACHSPLKSIYDKINTRTVNSATPLVPPPPNAECLHSAALFVCFLCRPCLSPQHNLKLLPDTSPHPGCMPCQGQRQRQRLRIRIRLRHGPGDDVNVCRCHL